MVIKPRLNISKLLSKLCESLIHVQRNRVKAYIYTMYLLNEKVSSVEGQLHGVKPRSSISKLLSKLCESLIHVQRNRVNLILDKGQKLYKAYINQRPTMDLHYSSVLIIKYI
jgi:inhibitor of KinA sporulation pathway (predicted exonuclease)